MDVQIMLRTSIVLLAITALGGLVMAGIRFSGRPHPPSFIAMLHGLLAASGLTLAVYASATSGLPGGGWLGLVLMLAAVLGGLVLNLRYHWERRALPVWLVLVHGTVAGVGLVALAVATWNLR